MESGPPESCKTMKNRGMIPENNNKIRPKGRILFCDCLTQYAERKPAIDRAVLLDFRQAKTIRLEFAPGQARYAEREPATSRVGPMVLFDHRPTRTNWLPALPGDRSGSFTRLKSSKMYQSRAWPPALPGKNPPFPEKQGIFHTNCPSQYAERKLATGRAVLLDFRQAKPTRHELGRRPRPT